MHAAAYWRLEDKTQVQQLQDVRGVVVKVIQVTHTAGVSPDNITLLMRKASVRYQLKEEQKRSTHSLHTCSTVDTHARTRTIRKFIKKKPLSGQCHNLHNPKLLVQSKLNPRAEQAPLGLMCGDIKLPGKLN